MKKRFLLSVTGLFILIYLGKAQPYTLRVSINNQSYNTVAIGSLKGDQFLLCDSLITVNSMSSGVPKKTVTWTFPSDAEPGTYRVVLGQTTYARVMNESPQQFDFIYNKEDIRLETDFKAPVDSMKVISSEENRVWFSFLKKEEDFKKQLEDLEMEVNFYQDKISALKAAPKDEEVAGLEKKAASASNSFNLLQMERDTYVKNAAAENPHLFASRIITLHREPFRDGYLSQVERKAAWQKEYFRYVDFSDETLMHTPVLTDKIFDFLVTYNQREFTKAQREDAYIGAVKQVMTAVEDRSGKGGMMYEFVLDYLVDGFERLEMDKVLIWIADSYAESLCSTDEKTTLLRKLEAQKMVKGTLVPDFTLNDMHGHPVTFSRVSKKTNLIVFWASWCPHCRTMLPGIKSLCSGMEDLGIFAIALDRSKSEWQKAVAEAGVETFIHLSDLEEWDGKTAEEYNIYATPTLFLVDSNRKVIARPSSLEELSGILSTY